MFSLMSTWLALYPRESLAEDAMVSPKGTGVPGFALAPVGSEKLVDDVFALALKARGVPIKEPQEVFWGGYSSYFADPDGFLWEVAWNPYTDLT